MDNNYLVHYGIKGQKWGVRRYQNEDGTLTAKGKKRYGSLNPKKYENSDYPDGTISKGSKNYDKLKRKAWDQAYNRGDFYTSNQIVGKKQALARKKKYDYMVEYANKKGVDAKNVNATPVKMQIFRGKQALIGASAFSVASALYGIQAVQNINRGEKALGIADGAVSALMTVGALKFASEYEYADKGR